MITRRRMRMVVPAAGLVLLTLVPIAGGRVRARAQTSTSSDFCGFFQSIGAASPNAVEYGIPIEIYGGAPYVETEISAQPKARALASYLYPGQIGEILLQTSTPEVQKLVKSTSTEVFYPPVQGAKSSAGSNLPPLAQDFATTGPGPSALSWASFGGQSQGGGFALGPAYAESQASFHDGILTGEDASWSYDVQLGPARISSMRSSITYSTDGTAAGTKASWQLEFLGIHSGSSNIAELSANGISLSGGKPMPGPSAANGLTGTVQQLSDLLQKAGVGALKLSLQPGAVQISAGQATVQGAGLVVTLEPKALRGNIGHNAQLLLGYEDRTISFSKADCGSGSQTSDSPTSPPVSGTDNSTVSPGATTTPNPGSATNSAASPGVQPASAQPSSPEVAAPASASPAGGPTAALAAPTRLPTRQVPVAGAAALWGRKLYDWALMTMLIGLGGLVALYGVVRHLLSRT